MKLKSSIARDSFFCGLAISVLSLLLLFFEQTGALLILANLLPGFIYGIVLCEYRINRFHVKQLLFIALSGALYIFVIWITNGHSVLGHNTFLIYPLGSALGSTILFLLYYLLINNQLQFYKGIGMAFLIGALSAIAPLVDDIAIVLFKADTISWGKLPMAFTLLIFVIWQSLFGWNIGRWRKGL